MVSISCDLIEIGVEKGIQQGIENTIIKLIESGMDPETVFDIIKPDGFIRNNVLKKLKTHNLDQRQ